MSTHGWEDDDDYVARGIKRDSPEGQAQLEREYRLKQTEEKEKQKATADTMHCLELLKAKVDGLRAEESKLIAQLTNVQAQLQVAEQEFRTIQGDVQLFFDKWCKENQIIYNKFNS